MQISPCLDGRVLRYDSGVAMTKKIVDIMLLLEGPTSSPEEAKHRRPIDSWHD